MPIDREHVPQKKKKRILEFPDGRPIPVELQRFIVKLKECTDTELHNNLIDLMEKMDAKGMITASSGNYQLYLVIESVWVYNDITNIIWLDQDFDKDFLNYITKWI